MTYSTGHAMFQLGNHQRDELCSNLGELILSHASRAEAHSYAVWTDPIWVVLGLLQRDIVIVLQTEAAKLFGAAKVYILFVLPPLLLIFEDLSHHYYVNQFGELGLYV